MYVVLVIGARDKEDVAKINCFLHDACTILGILEKDTR